MIGSVQKATKILNVISEGKNSPVSLMDISIATGINKSTYSHIISTLAEEGYVKKISHSSGYVIGPAVFCLSRFGKYSDDFISVCHPIIKWLHKKTKYTIVLAVIESGRRYTIDYIDIEQPLLPEASEIIPDNIYNTATGRIIMANMNSNEIKELYEKTEILEKGNWENIESLAELEKALSEIDKHGIVKTCRTENGNLLIGYAAAIFKYTKCVGAVGVAVSCPPEEYENFTEEENMIKNNILKARAEINRRLKYS